MAEKALASGARTSQAGSRPRSRSPWAISTLALLVSLVGLSCLGLIIHSLNTRQLDPKGCRMSYMRPSYARLDEFDTEHTRFASKYSLYLYREQYIDDDTKVRACAAAMLGSLPCLPGITPRLPHRTAPLRLAEPSKRC